VRGQHLLHGCAEVAVGVNGSSESSPTAALSSTSGDGGDSSSSLESSIAAAGAALGSREVARMELDVGESNLGGGGGAGERKREGEKVLGSRNARGEGAKQERAQ
jgi:hypothetical protein